MNASGYKACAREQQNSVGYTIIQYSELLGKLKVRIKDKEARIDIPKMKIGIYCGNKPRTVSIFSPSSKRIYTQSFKRYRKVGIQSLSFLKSGEQWQVKLKKLSSRQEYAGVKAITYLPIIPAKPDGRFIVLPEEKIAPFVTRFLQYTLNTPYSMGIPLYYKRPVESKELRAKGQLTSLRLETFLVSKGKIFKSLKPPTTFKRVKEEREVTQPGKLRKGLEDAIQTWHK